MRFLLLMYRKGVLDNGLRVLTTHMAHTRSVCVAFFVGAGSRHESDEEAGASHFVEHLCFKGTQRRASSKEIAETIEGVGGVLNGATDKELTFYWCKVACSHFTAALDLLADMMRHSRLDAQDIERERAIIAEEISEGLDSPQHQVNLLIDEVMWRGHPLGRDIIGSRETVAGMGRDVLLDYLARRYVPNNMVISVAGDIEHDEVMSSVSQALCDWDGGELAPPVPVADCQTEPCLRIERSDTEQAHLCLALRALPFTHPDRYALDLINVVLGAGMSSRLFLQIRERLGLAYDISSYVDHFLDCGMFTVYAGVDPKRLGDTVDAILEEIARVKEGIPDEEITKAKELAKGRLLLRAEDSRNIAGWVGDQELMVGRVRTVDEVISIIDAVPPDDMKRVANQLFISEGLNLAVVGPIDDDGKLAQSLRL